MKKIRSPPRDKVNPVLSYSLKNNIQKQLQKPYRPITNIFNTVQEQQQKRTANSIQKVLRELTDLKKELKQIKNHNKSQNQGLDMSVCRKLNHDRKSPSPPQHSHSSSRRKASSHKKEISTQTKPRRQQINQFSFSIDQKSAKKQKNLEYQGSQQDQEQINPFTFKSQRSTKRFKHSQSVHDVKPAKQTITQRLAAIEASELYQRSLNSLKQSQNIIELSSGMYQAEDKLRLNIEVQRLSKNILRIPIFLSKPEQYYDTIQLYARNVNNQLNNLILNLNRCQQRNNKLKQRHIVDNINKELSVCKDCEQKEKKGVERHYKKELKRYIKQLHRYEQQLEYRGEEEKRLREVVVNLMKEIDKFKQDQIRHKYDQRQWENKNRLMKEELQRLERVVVESEAQKTKQVTKHKMVEEQMNYYKVEVERLKGNYYQNHLKDNQQQTKTSYLQIKNKELEMMVAEVKGKEELYRNIITQKDSLIQDLKQRCSKQQHTIILSNKKQRRKQKYSDDDSVDSEEYHRLKHELRQKEHKCRGLKQQIVALQHQKFAVEMNSKELNNNLQLCLGEIQKLHVQIDVLTEANEKFKDKYLKTKILTDKKSRKQTQTEHRKVQNFRQINDLIKRHREGLTKQKK